MATKVAIRRRRNRSLGAIGHLRKNQTGNYMGRQLGKVVSFILAMCIEFNNGFSRRFTVSKSMLY